MSKSLVKTEFGDFQTPIPLALEVCELLARQGTSPAAIVEPTCGQGAFVSAAVRTFPMADVWGFDINTNYIETCGQTTSSDNCNLGVADFFQMDWPTMLASLPEPILVVGNPPWVTNAALGSLGSRNLPTKSNFQRHKGLDAITGKSNFDISEWMLTHFLDWLDGRTATLAMLCKTVVARKVLQHAWKHGRQIARSELHPIDALTHFNAAVDACLLWCDLRPGIRTTDCQVANTLSKNSASHTFGYYDGRVISELSTYSRWRHLAGVSSYRWRSGIKHDCSKVIELSDTGDELRNGFGDRVELETEYLFPMLKSSELANNRTGHPKRWMIVPQRESGQDTRAIATDAPKTWQYLLSHARYLDSRGSSIYRKRPRFSVFGIGSYSFAPWKVAVSGFYKSLSFSRVGSFQDKPIVLDDTAYLLPCQSQEEADFLYGLLVSEPAQEFLSSQIFWDAKRPITTDLLATLSLDHLAAELGRSEDFSQFASENPWTCKRAERLLFE